MEHLLSIKEVSERAGISPGLLYKLIRQGLGPTTIKLGRRTLIAESDGVAWVHSRRTANSDRAAA